MPEKALTTTDPRELALLKAVGFDRLQPEQRELALAIAAKYELDTMLKHLVMIEGRPYITRDGLLHVAHRSGQLDGIETTEPEIRDGFWRASCSVYRKDMTRPFTYGGRYPTTGGNQKFAPEMAVKVAEVMALRRAFDVAAPVMEERWDIPETAGESKSAAAPSLAERAAAKRAEVETQTGISRDDFLAALERAEISGPDAVARGAVLFPGIEPKSYSDAQRFDLLNDLIVPPDVDAARDLTPTEQAEIDGLFPEPSAA
jgi:hypothetical protein